MAVLLGVHPQFMEHSTGAAHPESPERLVAVEDGIAAAHIEEALVRFVPRQAARRELLAVHRAAFLDALQATCQEGPGAIDVDTPVGGLASWSAAVHAAGAGVDAVERLDRGEGEAAFLAVRPPGHHAEPARAMGFCLLNSVAVAAAHLADRGERVLVLDFDVHHGNGTQAAFYADPRVLYVSLHQHPLYPGTGSAPERGEGPGMGTTLNVPLPPGTRGDAFRRALDEVVVPCAESFGATWLVGSAGFDAHRADPLADLELSSGDFFDITARAVELVAPGRRVLFLEGGYDLQALASSAAACVSALAGGSYRPEAATSGTLGIPAVEAARAALVAG